MASPRRTTDEFFEAWSLHAPRAAQAAELDSQFDSSRLNIYKEYPLIYSQVMTRGGVESPTLPGIYLLWLRRRGIRSRGALGLLDSSLDTHPTTGSVTPPASWFRRLDGANGEGIFVNEWGVLNSLPESRPLVPTLSLRTVGQFLRRRGCAGRGNDQPSGLGRAREPLIVGNENRQLLAEQHG